MANFKASKIRSVKQIKSGDGSPIIPNFGIANSYEKEIMPYVSSMLEDYKKEILGEFETPEVHRLFMMDESVSSKFNRMLKRLEFKWSNVFAALGKKVAKDFVEKASSAADKEVDYSLSVGGIKQPRKTYNENIANTVSGYVHYNETLITNIHSEVNEKLYNAVMLSLTSPNPEEQGQSGISRALKDVGITSKERVKLIARDQTSKLYSSLASERMLENGVQYFRWLHVMESDAKNKGRIAWRQSHLDLDGEVFRVDDPELWTLGKYFTRKGDIGIPGHAINCHCRMVPIVIPSAEDLASIERRYGKKAREEMELAA